MAGWIKLHRKLLKWEWFSDHNTLILFVYLILAANFESKKWLGNDVPRGSIITSLPRLAKETGLSVKQIRGSLEKLIRTGEITRRNTNRNSIITVKKYAFYQADARADGSQDAADAAENGATDGQAEGSLAAATQESKNLNNFKKNNNAGARANGENTGFQSFSDVLKSKGIKI